MAIFLRRLDAGWMLYSGLVGQSPALNRQHNGKPTIAAVPDPSYTCGMGCGNMTCPAGRRCVDANGRGECVAAP